MEQKTKTIVKIAGREYLMRGVESEEYIHKVAIYVNRKMEEMDKAQPSLSTSMVAVLTAVNLADEVLTLKETVASLQNELKALKEVNKRSESNVQPALYDLSRKGKA